MDINIHLNIADKMSSMKPKKNVMTDDMEDMMEGEEEDRMPVNGGPMFIDKDGNISDMEIPKEGQIPKMMDKKGEFLKKLRSKDDSLLELDGQEVG